MLLSNFFFPAVRSNFYWILFHYNLATLGTSGETRVCTEESYRLRKGAVDVAPDGFDSPRISNCAVSNVGCS